MNKAMQAEMYKNKRQMDDIAALILGAQNDPMANALFKPAALPPMADPLLAEILKKLAAYGGNPNPQGEGRPDPSLNAMVQRVKNGQYHGE